MLPNVEEWRMKWRRWARTQTHTYTTTHTLTDALQANKTHGIIEHEEDPDSAGRRRDTNDRYELFFKLNFKVLM